MLIFLGKVLLNTFNWRFTNSPEFQTHLTLQVNLSKAWGLWGGDGIPNLGFRCSHHPPQAVLSRPVMVTTTYWGGWANVSFYACRPPNTTYRGASTCKEHRPASPGGPFPPVRYLRYSRPKGTRQAGERCSATVPLLPHWSL